MIKLLTVISVLIINPISIKPSIELYLSFQVYSFDVNMTQQHQWWKEEVYSQYRVPPTVSTLVTIVDTSQPQFSCLPLIFGQVKVMKFTWNAIHIGSDNENFHFDDEYNISNWVGVNLFKKIFQTVPCSSEWPENPHLAKSFWIIIRMDTTPHIYFTV